MDVGYCRDIVVEPIDEWWPPENDPRCNWCGSPDLDSAIWRTNVNDPLDRVVDWACERCAIPWKIEANRQALDASG